MKNRSHIYKIFIGFIISLNSCTNYIEHDEAINGNGNSNLTEWIKEVHGDITNSNKLLEKETYKIKDSKIIKRTIEVITLNQVTETNFIYENKLLKSKVEITNNSIIHKTAYTYNSKNELIEKLLVRYSGTAIRDYKKTLYSHNNNFVDITELVSNDGVNYGSSNRIISIKLNFDANNNLIQREIFYKGDSGMQDYLETTDFTYDNNFNLIATNPSFYESCTYSNIKNPIESIYSSTYGKKNFQLLNYLNIYPLLDSSISHNILETFKRDPNTNNEIINDFDLNGILSKQTIFESYDNIDDSYRTTHNFIYE